MATQPAPGSNTFITFDMADLTVLDPGLAATTVIESTSPFQVQVDFSFAGSLAPWLVFTVITMNFDVRFESIGGGQEITVGPVAINTTAGQLNYQATVNVAAGQLNSGVYKMVGVVAATIPIPPPVIPPPVPPIAGYLEGDIIHIT